jgi:hypothetical protein
MPTFQGTQGAFTPATTNDNWALDFGVTAGTFGKITMIGWGGRLTTSTGYRTRWCRPTAAGTGTRNPLVVQPGQPNYSTAGATLCGGVGATLPYGTAQPTLPTDPANLWAQDWNGQGGVGGIALPLNNPWWVVNGVTFGTICCRNVAGLDPNGSEYSVQWEE